MKNWTVSQVYIKAIYIIMAKESETYAVSRKPSLIDIIYVNNTGTRVPPGLLEWVELGAIRPKEQGHMNGHQGPLLGAPLIQSLI